MSIRRLNSESVRELLRNNNKLLFLMAVFALIGAISVIVFNTISPIIIGTSIFILVFGFMWPIFYLTSRRYKLRLRADSKEPFFSVLVPARNEENVVANIIDDIKKQFYEKWELIVIVNNSTDNTYEVANKAAMGDSRIRVLNINPTEKGKAIALNEGLKTANGDVIVQFDADNRVRPGFLSKFTKYFKDSAVHAVQSVIRAHNGKENLLTMLQDMEFIIYSRVFNKGRRAIGLSSSIGGTGVAVRKEVLDRIGGWKNELVEDYELLTRLTENDANIEYADDAITYDEKPAHWDELLRQRKRWIRGHLNVMKAKMFKKKRSVWDTLYLLTPLNIMAALGLFITGQLYKPLLHNYVSYSFISPYWWLASIALILFVLVDVMVKEKEPKYVFLTPVYILFFAFHWIIVLLSSFRVKSWGATKTYHYGEKQFRSKNKAIGAARFFGVQNRKSLMVFASVGITALLWLQPLATYVTAHKSGDVRMIATIPIASANEAKCDYSTLTGTVFAEGVGRLEGAKIRLYSSPWSYKTAYTNSEGRFKIKYLQQGWRWIQVTKSGYETTSGWIYIPNNSIVDSWITMIPTGQGGYPVIICPY